MDTRDVVLTFGKHRGLRIQQVPVSYLLFMARNETPQHEWASAELNRRGTVVPTIEVSGHAIDSASLRLRRTWLERAGPKEGLHAWLCRQADRAYKQIEDGRDRVDVAGVTWVFDRDGRWPILKTVWPAKEVTDGEDEMVDPGDDGACDRSIRVRGRERYRRR